MSISILGIRTWLKLANPLSIELYPFRGRKFYIGHKVIQVLTIKTLFHEIILTVGNFKKSSDNNFHNQKVILSNTRSLLLIKESVAEPLVIKNIRSKMITFLNLFRYQNNSADIKTDIHTCSGPRSPRVIQERGLWSWRLRSWTMKRWGPFFFSFIARFT